MCRNVKVNDGPLLLTPLIEKGKYEKARSLSKVDPTLFAGLQSHSAFITVNKTLGSHLFFWFFPVEDKPLESTPWIIWLQGGPGVSSLFGVFLEIGPLQFINGTGTLGTKYSCKTSNGTCFFCYCTWNKEQALISYFRHYQSRTFDEVF